MSGELVRMASKWRIDGVFWTCALKKRGQDFTRVGLLVTSGTLGTRGPGEREIGEREVDFWLISILCTCHLSFSSPLLKLRLHTAINRADFVSW